MIQPVSPLSTLPPSSSYPCIDASVIIAGKPKRCLTAYNIFFQQERQRLLANLPQRDEVKSKKAHGKIGFAELGRTISKNWKAVTATQRAYYRDLADKDKERYLEEMQVWRAQLAEEGGVGARIHNNEDNGGNRVASSRVTPLTSPSSPTSSSGRPTRRTTRRNMAAITGSIRLTEPHEAPAAAVVSSLSNHHHLDYQPMILSSSMDQEMMAHMPGEDLVDFATTNNHGNATFASTTYMTITSPEEEESMEPFAFDMPMASSSNTSMTDNHAAALATAASMLTAATAPQHQDQQANNNNNSSAGYMFFTARNHTATTSGYPFAAAAPSSAPATTEQVNTAAMAASTLDDDCKDFLVAAFS